MFTVSSIAAYSILQLLMSPPTMHSNECENSLSSQSWPLELLT